MAAAPTASFRSARPSVKLAPPLSFALLSCAALLLSACSSDSSDEVNTSVAPLVKITEFLTSDGQTLKSSAKTLDLACDGLVTVGFSEELTDRSDSTVWLLRPTGNCSITQCGYLRLTATNETTQKEISVVEVAGRFALLELPAGSYQLKIEAVLIKGEDDTPYVVNKKQLSSSWSGAVVVPDTCPSST